MNLRDESTEETVRCPNQGKGGGAVPASSLFFHVGEVQDVNAMVVKYHYSHRPAGAVQAAFSLHERGGLFGTKGPLCCGCTFSIPPTRWSEDVLELSRLVRRDDVKPPLTMLIAFGMRWLKANTKWDLAVSFADKTQGHEGTVYRAAGWHCNGDRKASMDGLVIDGLFHPGRVCNTLWGTRSAERLRKLLPHRVIEEHWDEGKRLFWMPIKRSGFAKAERLGLTDDRKARAA